MAPLNLQTRITFVDADDRTDILIPAERIGRIHSAAAVLRQQVSIGSIVGLLYRSEPNLVVAWLACLAAGLKPLILQYPNRKQARTYWQESIDNTVATIGIAAIVADNHCATLMEPYFAGIIVAQSVLDTSPDELESNLFPDAFSIIQLSSGTTGYRKAIEFTHEQLAQHVEDFNKVLRLEPSDRIASWLPLYHDMGYIACFVMPLMLGIDVVMMDPITWVQSPEMLFTAIEQHLCTLCYMPNFGFEVMARSRPRPLPSMRRWISCSEPVSERTSAKFIAAVEAPTGSFSPCYAMAENIFAVTLAEGCRTRSVDGVEVVSCGRSIPGVDLKVVDGEIWVRSRSSIVEYLSSGDIRDAEGFYATGDLGHLIDGELYVSGRRLDLMIQAGRKYILSDIDLRVGELFAEVRGRAAALALRDERLGTEMPTVLVEAPDFFTRTDSGDIATAVKDATGLDQLDVALVPPRFLTKTSSGKINRRLTAANWAAMQSTRNGAGPSARSPREELARSFAALTWDQPVGEVLDSLAQTVLRIVLDPTPVPFSPTQSLREIDAALEQAAEAQATAPAEQAEGLRIVSLANRQTLRHLSKQHLLQLEQMLGCPVSLEHVCLPPSALILSDLVFHDYFRPRLDMRAFSAVDHAMAQLKGASIILTDDVAELFFLYESTYPVLSHNLERDPRADLISFRWQQYTKHHHELPLTVVAGNDIPLANSTGTLQQLQDYLGTPIFRIGVIREFEHYTAGWDHHAFGTHITEGIDADQLMMALVAWTRTLSTPPAHKPLRPRARMTMTDLGHFCSLMVNPAAIDKIIASFDRFCIAGERSSLPYVSQKLDVLGKPYIRVPSHSRDILSSLRPDFDCLLICGSVGQVEGDIPAVALQHADMPWRLKNIEGTLADALPPLWSIPTSGTDWFHTFEFKRNVDHPVWLHMRQQEARRQANQHTPRSRQLERPLA